MPEIVHTCACGRPYTSEEWDSLPLVGLQSSVRGVELELRLCSSCGSSRSMRLAVSNWEKALLTAVICLFALGLAELALVFLSGVWR